jgi:hypothetical protein
VVILIENMQASGINEIIVDIKLIHAIYRLFTSTVKSESRKTWPSVNKKGEIYVLD